MIEHIGEIYGLTLNKSKVEYMATNKNPQAHFRNGKPVKRVDGTKYLGININIAGNTKKVKQRIAICIKALETLYVFLKKA